MEIGKLLRVAVFARKLMIAAVCGTMLSGASNVIPKAKATTIYDGTLAAPGAIFGSGNPDNHYTLDQTPAMTVGLAVATRYTGPNVTPDPGTNIYHVLTGVNALHGGSLWGISFTVDGRGGGLTTNDFSAYLSMTDSVTGAAGPGFDVRLLPDNTGYDGTNIVPGNDPSALMIQNSETPSFASIAAALGDPGFNSLVPGTYGFTLTAYTCPNGGCRPSLLASTNITVIAEAAPVPEPSTLKLLGLGLLGFGTILMLRKPTRTT